MPLVRVPAPYRGPTRGEAEIAAAGATVRECLDDMEARYPGFRAQILDDDGRTHRFVRLFLNGQLLGPAALDARVGPDDALDVLAAIAGG
jgi:molybdopterin converting factor small subunit